MKERVYRLLLLSACYAQPQTAQAPRLEVPEDSSSAAYLGCAVEAGPRNILSFASSDRDMPFVSADDAMWSYFEPELGRRVAELETDESFSSHVRSALIEALPGAARTIARAVSA